MNLVGTPWVVVLAGGSGERLRSVTASPEGTAVPKQFCRIDGRDSMLDITLARARGVTTPDRIVVVLREEHRPWWQHALTGIRPNNALVHGRNRGTAIALLHALLHVSGSDSDACLVVLPSDHVVDDELVMRRTILHAVDEARCSHTDVVLIGAPAESPDPSLGWIVPGSERTDRTRAVLEFVEKPDHARAAECVRRGALRNTLILAGGARALLNLYAHEGQPFAELYPDLPDMDLGRDVLQRSARYLRLLPLPDCGWTDIGTLGRLEAWWASHPNAWDRVRASGVLPGPDPSWDMTGRQAPEPATPAPVLSQHV